MKVVKKIGFVLLIIFLVLQAFRPVKNNSGNKENDISTIYPVPENVQQIFTESCNNCHSNNTEYPWYSNIQPVAWWLDDHIKEGKKELNLNEFAKYRIAKQYRKLEECIDEVKEGEMPFEYYTFIHNKAILTTEEKEIIFDWATELRDTIKARYPADSLVIKKKK